VAILFVIRQIRDCYKSGAKLVFFLNHQTYSCIMDIIYSFEWHILADYDRTLIYNSKFVIQHLALLMSCTSNNFKMITGTFDNCFIPPFRITCKYRANRHTCFRPFKFTVFFTFNISIHVFN